MKDTTRTNIVFVLVLLIVFFTVMSRWAAVREQRELLHKTEGEEALDGARDRWVPCGQLYAQPADAECFYNSKTGLITVREAAAR
jgi:hypothetical protein